MGDTLKLRMAKETRFNNVIDGCSNYLMWINYAIVWLYVDKCAYAGITNFKLCSADEDCLDCESPLATLPFVG